MLKGCRFEEQAAASFLLISAGTRSLFTLQTPHADRIDVSVTKLVTTTFVSVSEVKAKTLSIHLINKLEVFVVIAQIYNSPNCTIRHFGGVHAPIP